MKRDLKHKILLGVVSAGFIAAQISPIPAEAATSLYEEYQSQQNAGKGRNVPEHVAQNEKKAKQQAEAAASKGSKAEKPEKKSDRSEKKESEPKPSMPDKVITKSGSESDSEGLGDPAEFNAKIQKILDEYQPSNKYSRFADSKIPDSESAGIREQGNPAPSYDNKALGTDALFDFDWKGTPLAQSIYAVAKMAGKGIIVNGDLKGSVFMSLKQVTCNQTLDYLARAYSFNWMPDGNNIIISTEDKMLQSDVIDISYADKDKMKEEFKSLGIEEKNIYANMEMGTISITGTPYQISQARERVRRLDHPVSQCLLVAQLVEISHGKSLKLGMQYTLPTYSHTGNEKGSGSFKGNWAEKLTFGASMTADRALSKGHVIARPMVMTLNGETGYVYFGDQVPVLSQTSTSSSTNVTVEYKDVGTNLKVTPAINERIGEVTLKIEAEVSNIVSWMNSGHVSAPQIATRRATTSAHLRSGQSIVIGGLMNVKNLDNLSGIPGLMNLPILGELFKYHSRSKEYSEVFILLTPYIVSDSIDPTTILRKVEKIEEKEGDPFAGK